MAVDPSSNTGNLPRFPHPRWAETVTENPNAIRDEEENYSELDRWARDMLKRRWPGSGHLTRSPTVAGGVVGPIAPGGTVVVPSLFTIPETFPLIGATDAAVVELHIQVQPQTPGINLLDCDIVTGAGTVYNWIMGAAVGGDDYPMNIVETVDTGAAYGALTFNVYPPSLHAVVFTYAARYSY